MSLDDQRSFGKLTCKANGNAVSVESVAFIWVKDTGETNEILAVTRNSTTATASLDGMIGNGTLQNNGGSIVLDQMDADICGSSYFLCEVVYMEPSGEMDRAIATAWPRQPQSVQPGMEDSNRTADLPDMKRKAEEMSAALEMLNMTFTKEMTRMQNEREAQAWILSRLEELETLSASLSQAQSCQVCSNVTQALEKLERRLDGLENGIGNQVI
ncbi:hypothetical protein ElyMa_004404600 [Elysia marginata]|uniref:Ig-like domain-containing protein n=1 Tax=Elysia marginata TaxID=1093978 RepID=A0AAV4H9S5_9GAST|nr:hypothetical protein ElyMa_004404600 [Elysia marginata]